MGVRCVFGCRRAGEVVRLCVGGRRVGWMGEKPSGHRPVDGFGGRGLCGGERVVWRGEACVEVRGNFCAPC